MKRLTLLIICIALSFALTAAQPVYAAENAYARAAVRDAYFFSEKSYSTSLFAVPYTYCVEVLRDDGDWYYCRYATDTGVYKTLYGYCRKSDFTLETTAPEVTYLYKTVTVNYSATGGNSTLPVLNQLAMEAAYYGTYYSGATVYSYVYCQGSFGYIEGANDDYPLNLPKEETPSDGAVDPAENGAGGGWSTGLIAAAVISALAAAVIVILYFATRKPKVE